MSKSDNTFEPASIILGPALAANGNEPLASGPRALAIEATSHISRGDLAKHLYEMRRKRDDYFPAELFAEPAWDILLLLYWAGEKKRPIGLSAMSVFAGVPDTTALRWIQKVIDAGLVAKASHDIGLRVSSLTLTPQARTALDEYLTLVIDRSC